MAKTQFTSAKLKSVKLESAKSVKDDMTDQQQNSDDIIDSFDMSNQLSLNFISGVQKSVTSLNKASFSEASFSKSELPAFYQCLDCSHVNIQM